MPILRRAKFADLFPRLAIKQERCEQLFRSPGVGAYRARPSSSRSIFANQLMGFFNFADWAIIVVYLLGIIGLGVWFGKDQHNTRDYFLGSKNTPWWGIGMSIVA